MSYGPDLGPFMAVTTITGATSFEVGYGSGGTLSAFGSGLGFSHQLTNPEMIAGVDYLASINLITSARAATILSGAPHG